MRLSLCRLTALLDYAPVPTPPTTVLRLRIPPHGRCAHLCAHAVYLRCSQLSSQLCVAPPRQAQAQPRPCATHPSLTAGGRPGPNSGAMVCFVKFGDAESAAAAISGLSNAWLTDPSTGQPRSLLVEYARRSTN